MSRERFNRYVGLAKRFGARTVLFLDAAAHHLNLTASQLDCFRIVQHEGPLTASDLVLETGLTPAALSVIIDRLVVKGFLTREQDGADRRRWLLRTSQAAIEKVDAVYAEHASRAEKLLDEYSDEEFETVLRFMDRFAEELKLTATQLTQRNSNHKLG